MKNVFGGKEYKNCKDMDLETKIRAIYDDTERNHDERVEDYETNRKNLEEVFKSNLEKINSDENIKKLYDMVHANLLLRMGQCEEEAFNGTKNNFFEAIKILNRYASEKIDGKDEIGCLIQLSIAKYFRSMGHCDKRSHFVFAYHELEKLKNGLEELGSWNNVQSQIWLDTKLNIGRNYKNRYEFVEAEKYLWNIVEGLKWKFNLTDDMGNSVYRLKILKIEVISEEEKVNYKKLNVDIDIVNGYMMQAFVQLAIIYRKMRKYDEAILICDTVREQNKENVDINNTLGVCYRKNQKYDEAKKIFENILEKNKKNRFANINRWKCIIDQADEIINERENFKKFIEENKTAHECRLLSGRVLLMEKQYDEAYKEFEELYKDFPHLNQGSIALKAYYNMAKCLIIQERYKQALHILEEILSACEKDVLALIDKGWCLMRLGQYTKAKKHYEKMLNISRDDIWSKLKFSSDYSKYDKIRFLNNLAECYIKSGDSIVAYTIFEMVTKEEENNRVAYKFLSQRDFLEGEKAEYEGNKGAARVKYNETIEKLKLIKNKDASIESRIVRAYTNIYKMYRDNDDEVKNYCLFLEKRLLYYPHVCYTQRACAEMAEFFDDTSKLDENTLDYMYQVFSRIQLSEKAEGYQSFHTLMVSSEFNRLNAKERGMVLSILFPLYREIINIKKMCRYSPEEGKNDLPVHYTRISTLTKLLAEENSSSKPRLRLWNSANMNDPHEGTCFWEMVKIMIEEQNQRDGKNEEDERNKLYKYFPMFAPEDRKEEYKDVRGNIYTTSFSRKKDDLLMWVAYGDKAKGCNITFSDEFLDVKYSNSEMMDESLYTDSDIPLYEVQYINMEKLENKTICIASSQEGEVKAEQIKDSIVGIWKYIKKLENVFKEINSSGSKINKKVSEEAIVEFVVDVINEVRYLFKDDEFEYEKELRVVKYAKDPQYEYAFEIPRPYINLERDIRIQEVKLGAKIEPLQKEEIETWLMSTGKVKKISKSEKHYK